MGILVLPECTVLVSVVAHRSCVLMDEMVCFKFLSFYVGTDVMWVHCRCWWPSVVLLGWFILLGIMMWAYSSCSYFLFFVRKILAQWSFLWCCFWFSVDVWLSFFWCCDASGYLIETEILVYLNIIILHKNFLYIKTYYMTGLLVMDPLHHAG